MIRCSPRPGESSGRGCKLVGGATNDRINKGSFAKSFKLTFLLECFTKRVVIHDKTFSATGS